MNEQQRFEAWVIEKLPGAILPHKSNTGYYIYDVGSAEERLIMLLWESWCKALKVPAYKGGI